MVSGGNVSLQFNWKMADEPICCCLVSIIIIRSILSGLSFSLIDSIQNKISVRQDSFAFYCENVNLCVISIQVVTEIMISNDLAERCSI